ncbi:MAG: hypothetical protein LBR13_04115 [Dysgonamonadaceae bacterium]|jgi:hypothetical protein|nr:hypothetical protein [Dysgonamonadaceae bacterium]
MIASLAYYVFSNSFEEVLDEKKLLNISALKAKMNPTIFNSYGNSYLYGIDESSLAEFKNDIFFDFMRLHTVRNEGHYVKSMLLEEDLAKSDISDENNRYDFFRYYFLELIYHRISGIYNPFSGDVSNKNLADYKTKGYMPQSFYTDKNFAVRAGLKWNF